MTDDLQQMLYKVIAACIAVIFAMMIDLACGLRKAKQRGEFRSSKGLRMTINKFLHYEGAMLLAAIFDFLIYISNIDTLFHLEVLTSVPMITCLVGMFLIIIEFHSVREKADQKSRKDVDDIAENVARIISSPTLRDAIVEALRKDKKDGKIKKQ